MENYAWAMSPRQLAAFLRDMASARLDVDAERGFLIVRKGEGFDRAIIEAVSRPQVNAAGDDRYAMGAVTSINWASHDVSVVASRSSVQEENFKVAVTLKVGTTDRRLVVFRHAKIDMVTLTNFTVRQVVEQGVPLSKALLKNATINDPATYIYDVQMGLSVFAALGAPQQKSRARTALADLPRVAKFALEL